MIQLVCSNCGADLKELPIKGGRIQCPYCSTINEFEGIDNKAEQNISDKTDKKIFYEPISLSVEDVDKICTDALAEDELAPDDIYQEISLKDYRLLYLPFSVLGGNYTYSCNYDKGGSKTSQNGMGSIYKRFLTYTGSDVPMPLKEKINKTSPTMASPTFLSADEGSINQLREIENCSVCEANSQLSMFFNLLGNDAREQTASKISGATNVAFTSFSTDFQSIKTIYVPYYVVELNYKGQLYYIAVCASSSGGFYSVLPIDEEREKQFKELADSVTTLAGVFLSIPFILGLIWMFGPLKFGNFLLLSIISWIIAGILIMIQDKKNKEIKAKIVEESRRKRLMHKI